MFGVVPRALWEKVAPPDDRNRIRMAMRAWLVQRRRTHDPDRRRCRRQARREGRRDLRLRGRPIARRFAGRRPALRRRHRPGHRLASPLRPRRRLHERGGRTAPCGHAFPTRATSCGAGSGTTLHPHERNRASYFAENYVPLAGGRGPGPGRRGRRGRTGHSRAAHRRPHDAPSDRRDRDGGQTAIFAADLLPTAAHLPLPYIMGFDLYPMDTLAFKRAFLAEAAERDI